MPLLGVRRALIQPSIRRPSYNLSGFFSSNIASNTLAGGANLGKPAPDRFVVVAVAMQNQLSMAAGVVTVNGVTLNNDVTTQVGVLISSGLVPFGSGQQAVSFTISGSAFLEREVTAWTLYGLSSNALKQSAVIGTGASTASISVSAGDFMFSVVDSNRTWSTSTQPPNAQRIITDYSSADWLIGATNASFSVAMNGSGADVAVATYH